MLGYHHLALFLPPSRSWPLATCRDKLLTTKMALLKHSVFTPNPRKSGPYGQMHESQRRTVHYLTMFVPKAVSFMVKQYG